MKKTSNSENLILQLFWNNKYQIACHEIYKRVREAYPNHWKDSSVAVFLMRMEEKELIRKAEIDGTKYWVSITQGQYSKNLLNSLLMKSENKPSMKFFSVLSKIRRNTRRRLMKLTQF